MPNQEPSGTTQMATIAVNIKNNQNYVVWTNNKPTTCKAHAEASLCSLWKEAQPVDAFLMEYSGCVGNDLLRSQRMIHDLFRKIFGFAEHPRLHIR